MKGRFLLLAVSLLVFNTTVSGYLVVPPLTIDKLAAEADVIIKGTAISSETTKDDWLKPSEGFVAQETKFRVVSVIKGDSSAEVFRFRHNDKDSTAKKSRLEMPGPEPQFYYFKPGRTYVVFARKTDVPATFRQLWACSNALPDQGVLTCADSAPVTAKSVKKALWDELTHMVRSAQQDDVLYGIEHLDLTSHRRHGFWGAEDFDRKEVQSAISPLMTRNESEIARAAISVIASENPYLSDTFAQYWLATIGSAEVPGIAQMDRKMKNPGGEAYWKELVAVADGKAESATRALAIRALGLARRPELHPAIKRWLVDPEPAVRASAVLLVADFPGPESNRMLETLANDPAPEVRLCVAHSAGFMQQAELASLLGRLLVDDKDDKVRRAASMSLLSFSPKNEAISAVFRANIVNREFRPLFLNALAAENPGKYLDAIAQVVVEKPRPQNWSGGQVPAFTALNILFKYLQAQPRAEVRSGKFDRYLDAMEKGYTTGSSEPRDIYAFYLQREMVERAKNYRAAANKAASYDLDYYFKQVDQAPGTYTR